MDAARDFDTLVLQDLFIEQAPKTPNAIAVVDGNIQLTYAQLDAVTSQLAVQLVEEFGVQPDTVVGILLPRSVQYVISCVAILKAGGAYMPVELVYPKPLRERALAETKAKCTLTNTQYANRVSELPHLVFSDQFPFVPDYETVHSYPSPSYTRPNADHLAFVVMSSGTTGTPKGICQTHRAAVHSYLDRFHRFPYRYNEEGLAEDRIGAGVFFVWEIFRPLCKGATCVVIPDHVLFDPPAVTQFVQDYKITRWLVTPSLLQLVLDTIAPEVLQEKLAALRYMWLCGEVVSRNLAVQFTSIVPDTEFLNLYGTSECHDVSIGDLKRDIEPGRKYATCGAAIPGVSFYIVDRKQKEANIMATVPDGETGEVYVGGPVVGRGYLNMPEKTAQCFVPNPFDDSWHTLYKTGDLGRLLPNGQLEVMGRCDFMVKIRGYSVVLGAVETALGKHPKLSSSVVLAIGKEGSKDKKLVAYVVPTDWHDVPSASSVRTFLKDHIPPYAIPTTFCVIDALPVTSTVGKLDRKKLPNPETAPRLRAFSEDLTNMPNAQRGPQRGVANDTEKGIMEIWCELLDVTAEELSALDSFFEVGGHSLLATKLVKLVNEKFGRTSETGLSIINVVESPTIRDMSKIILEGAQKAPKVTIDLQAEANSLDPSIFPLATRKADGMSRFRFEASALLSPRVVFLTGATGYLGAHILAELLANPHNITVIALARAKTDELAKERVLKTLQKYKLAESLKEIGKENSPEGESVLDSRLVAVAGDLSQPLLGMDNIQFKELALEVDSIIHCGAQVNFIRPYSSLKEANVLGTQEILRLATTNGFIKTKVKPVHYISTNGIFPVDTKAYKEHPICVKEDVNMEELAPNLHEGYAMTKWVAEQMCTIAEARGLPVSVLRPGNMAGSSVTGAQNEDDFNYLLIQGMLQAQCAPLVDTNYALDMTPVDFAARAAVYLAVDVPQKAMGQRFNLQSPQKPVPLGQVVETLRSMGYTIDAVTRNEWMTRIAKNEKLASGWLSFEPYFEASTWLQYGSDNLQQALQDSPLKCPDLNQELLETWFPRS